jgi:hypothetical protein
MGTIRPEVAMQVLVVDVLGLILVALGVMLVVKRPEPSASRAANGDDDPRVYMRRIAGTMMAAFGLALGLMVTLFHFAAVE